LDDSFASFKADEDWALRVTARISKEDFLAIRFLMSELPCFPVAPVMSTATILRIKRDVGKVIRLEVVWAWGLYEVEVE
jgi:hypothetical protein